MVPKILVVYGPSGVGKGTILLQLRESFKDKIVYSISHTTRSPRPSEQNGREYYFVSKEEFQHMLEERLFIEHNVFNGNYYGTSLSELGRLRTLEGHLGLLEIDVNGVKQLQQISDLKDSIQYVGIYPPSIQELERRIRGRGTESEESVQKRLQIALNELKVMDELPHNLRLENNDLERAIRELREFVSHTFNL